MGASPAAACAAPALLVLTLCGCGQPGSAPPGADQARWVRLAQGYRPPEGDAGQARPFRRGPGSWVDFPIARELWQPGALLAGQQEWRAPRPRTAAFGHHGAEAAELSSGERRFRRMDVLEQRQQELALGDGIFHVYGEQIFLRLPAGEEPAADIVYSTYVERSLESDGTWRAVARDLLCEGFPVWPGERVEIVCDLPEQSRLLVGTVARALREGAAGRVRFRITLDGRPLLEHEQGSALADRSAAHALSLPARGRSGARLAFEVEGDPAVALFANPVLAPLAGDDPRPDVLLFVADTLRADCLATYGGEAGLTPNLDALAARSLRFLGARSPSVWTLPAHASLFTGLLPPQHGATLARQTFSPELVTLAEHFSAHGYRTGAVTEGGFVSRYLGFEQGFEWFEEGERKLRDTLAAALEFLERDDGRPTFLFVHTYRVHEPYRTGPEEDRSALEELARRAIGRLEGAAEDETPREIAAEFAPEYRALYLEGVRDLDRQLGPFLAELERRRLFERGYFLFTSDHGEAFHEHGEHGHKGMPHEEKIRVPLLLAGRGLAARDVLFGASLIDVPPTLSALCSLPALESWLGESLLALERERVLFSYKRMRTTGYLAALKGPRKLLVRAPWEELGQRLARGELEDAFLLDSDPAERSDLSGREPWPAEMSRSVAPLWQLLDRPLVGPAEVTLDEEHLQELRALGYFR